MKLNEIRKIASQHSIKTGNVNKSDLVRSIQQAEGNQRCFNSGKVTLCGQDTCMWREDCD